MLSKFCLLEFRLRLSRVTPFLQFITTNCLNLKIASPNNRKFYFFFRHCTGLKIQQFPTPTEKSFNIPTSRNLFRFTRQAFTLVHPTAPPPSTVTYEFLPFPKEKLKKVPGRASTRDFSYARKYCCAEEFMRTASQDLYKKLLK